jgi:hypothetical protein
LPIINIKKSDDEVYQFIESIETKNYVDDWWWFVAGSATRAAVSDAWSQDSREYLSSSASTDAAITIAKAAAADVVK